ncbi:MAG TPA: DoxX family protein [Terriglobales bacterium]
MALGQIPAPYATAIIRARHLNSYVALAETATLNGRIASLSAILMGRKSTAVGQKKLSDTLPFLSPGDRIMWTRIVIASCFFIALALSKHVWVTTRHFPLIPVFSGLPQIPYPFDYVCLAVLGLLLVLIAASSAPKFYLLSFLSLLAVVALLDQCRWQPWVYQYALMLAGLTVFYWKGGKASDQNAALNICRLIVASIYFYSGLQKLNPTFAAHVFPHLLGNMGTTATAILRVLAIFPALLEAGIGVALLTKRFRNIGVIAAIVMHVFILAKYGPFGYDYNAVVWPWNLAMISLDVILFWKAEFSFADVLWRNPFTFQKAVLLLVLIMPFFSFFGWWDSYPSWSLYSGNVDGASLFCSDAVAKQLPGYLRQYITHVSSNNNRLSVRDWTMGELNVPGYPESRVYRRIGGEVCRLADNSPEIAMYIQQKSTWLGAGERIRDTCFGTLVNP